MYRFLKYIYNEYTYSLYTIFLLGWKVSRFMCLKKSYNLKVLCALVHQQRPTGLNMKISISHLPQKAREKCRLGAWKCSTLASSEVLNTATTGSKFGETKTASGEENAWDDALKKERVKNKKAEARDMSSGVHQKMTVRWKCNRELQIPVKILKRRQQILKEQIDKCQKQEQNQKARWDIRTLEKTNENVCSSQCSSE